MTLQQLLHLRAVMTEGGFGAAGRKLDLTQQAVSRSVRALEEELGKVLIDRSPGGLALTRNGEAVMSLASELLALVDEMKHSARTSDAASLKLRVGMSYWCSLTRCSAAILGVLDALPAAQLTLMPGATRTFSAQIAARELDFALCAEPGDGGTLTFTPLAEVSWGVAVRDGHPALLEGGGLDASALEWVAEPSTVGVQLAERLAAAFGGEAPRMRLRSGLPAFALRAILERDLAAAAPLDLDPGVVAGLGMRIIAPPQPVAMRHGLLRPRRRIAGLDWETLEADLAAAHAGASKSS
ncbi:MAG: LysR family transcriptional regulator [Oceanicaulis sp.]